MNSYPEHALVKKCLLLIEKQLGWGSSKSWHNDVFIELSEKIHEKTQVLLSPTTLKRVWGKVNYNSAPSISTLNTLAQFAGFLNWRDFKNKSAIKSPSFFSKHINPNLGFVMGSAALMTLLFISLYSLTGKSSVEPPDYSKVEFSSKSIADGLPNSVVFDFDLKEVESDSIYIQQFWDPTKTIEITKDQKQATGQYYYPGYFRAKLVIDGQIIKEHDLFIKSDGWLGTIDYTPIPKYIETEDILSNKLALKKSTLDEIKSSETPIQSTFHYVNELEQISGDNFELTTSIRNVYRDKWAVCQTTSIVIVGTKSAFFVPFSISGCISELGVMLSDIYLDGKKHDLSFLGTDMSKFRTIKIASKDKEFKVFIDNHNVLTHSYTKSIGNIVGMRFRFLGAGEVENIHLSNEKEKFVLNQDFGLDKIK